MVDICDPFMGDWVLRNTDVSEVWGVGRHMKMHLDALCVKTAMDLAKADPRMLRTKFSVVIEKTARSWLERLALNWMSLIHRSRKSAVAECSGSASPSWRRSRRRRRPT
ncbi:DNA polymerase V subunit UmuC [compost metagenome]